MEAALESRLVGQHLCSYVMAIRRSMDTNRGTRKREQKNRLETGRCQEASLPTENSAASARGAHTHWGSLSSWRLFQAHPREHSPSSTLLALLQRRRSLCQPKVNCASRASQCAQWARHLHHHGVSHIHGGRCGVAEKGERAGAGARCGQPLQTAPPPPPPPPVPPPSLPCCGGYDGGTSAPTRGDSGRGRPRAIRAAGGASTHGFHVNNTLHIRRRWSRRRHHSQSLPPTRSHAGTGRGGGGRRRAVTGPLRPPARQPPLPDNPGTTWARGGGGGTPPAGQI